MSGLTGWRRIATLVFALALVFGVLVTTVRVGARLPATDFLNPHSRVGGVDYSADSVRGLAPLRSAFIREALGSGASTALAAAPDSKTPTRNQPTVKGRRIVHTTPAGRNDSFSNVENVQTIPFTDNTNTSNTTVEPGEPQACAPTTGTVWYRFVPSKNVGLSASTEGSNFDTVLAVYTGTSLSTLSSLVCKDSGTFGRHYAVAFQAHASRALYFQVGGVGAARGDLVFNLDPAPRPPNDNFADATGLSKIPVTDRTNTAGAGVQPGEAQPTCISSTGATVWYRYTPRTDAPLVASTFGSDFATTLGVYTGVKMTALQEAACDASNTPVYPARVVFRPVAGRTYSFLVGGTFGDRGNLAFTLAAAPIHPPNDDFAHARAAGVPFADRPSTFGATIQTAEPRPSCATGIAESVWYRFTPGETMQLVGDTFESRADTVLAVYTGSALGDLQEVPLACSDDTAISTSSSGGTGVNSQVSQVTFTALAGETYFFQVGLKSDAQGNIAFNLDRAST
ncbi:MAG: hypothetical protein ABR548_05865 [Actinomycetota bacterium]|nr:hypothetical protein [Actinomycetota bacterium]